MLCVRKVAILILLAAITVMHHLCSCLENALSALTAATPPINSYFYSRVRNTMQNTCINQSNELIRVLDSIAALPRPAWSVVLPSFNQKK